MGYNKFDHDSNGKWDKDDYKALAVGIILFFGLAFMFLSQILN